MLYYKRFNGVIYNSINNYERWYAKKMNDFNYDDLPELDIENIKDDPILGPFLEMISHEAKRDKTLVLLPDAIIRIHKVFSAIKTLLDRDKSEDEYTIEIEHFDSFPKEISIKIETEGFGASQDDYWIFRDIINMTDDFSSEVVSEDKVRYYFGIKDAYREIPTNE